MTDDTFGARLSAAMKRAQPRLTNQEVGDALGTHPNTVSYWRSDKQLPEERQIERIVALLTARGVDIDAPFLRYGERRRSAVADAMMSGHEDLPELPRQLELLALDFEREALAADADPEFRRRVRRMLRDQELVALFEGGYADRPLSAEEQRAEMEVYIEGLRKLMKRRLARQKKGK